MNLKSNFYKVLKYSNDINAIKKGKIVKRVARREAGSFIQKLFEYLSENGFTRIDLEKISHKNMLRIFKDTWND